MDERHQKLLRMQQARQQAEEAIRDLARIAQNAEGGTYLVSDFRRRDDLPATASLRRMSNTVAKKLAELGFRDPVSLQSVPNRWWKVNIDAAEVGFGRAGCHAAVLGELVLDQLLSRDDCMVGSDHGGCPGMRVCLGWERIKRRNAVAS